MIISIIASLCLSLCQIESLVVGRRAEVSFNTSWLEDLYEEIVCELTGERVTPLVSNPGRIILTSSRLYFQPFNNVEVVRRGGGELDCEGLG